MKLGLYFNIGPEMGLRSDVKLDRLWNYAICINVKLYRFYCIDKLKCEQTLKKFSLIYRVLIYYWQNIKIDTQLVFAIFLHVKLLNSILYSATESYLMKYF